MSIRISESLLRRHPDLVGSAWGENTAVPLRGGADGGAATRTSVTFNKVSNGSSKQRASLREALVASGLKDGGTISFHHHLRSGDGVLNLVIAEAAAIGLRDLTVAASSLFPVHAPLVEHIRQGVVTGIYTSYASGPAADAVSRGLLARPMIMQTHGGRARAIEAGELRIDVAFVAAPMADEFGNVSGSRGRAACGPLGYAIPDAQYARCVVAVTDELVPYPCEAIDITQDLVDHVVVVESIGDPAGILSGTTRPTSDPVGLRIANDAAAVIEASGLLRDGFSFQTGAGGISLAVAAQLAQAMHRQKVCGSFAAGGITGQLVDMLEQGLFRTLFDVQCFDLRAVRSYREDRRHAAMSASLYANPNNRGAVVNRLDAMVLGAAEVDLDFNVNVTTGSDGRILGGSGGHSDTAAGARLAIVTTQLNSPKGPKLVKKVRCITTPGETIDVVVTEAGMAVNPRRQDLARSLEGAGLTLRSIAELQHLAAPASRGADELAQTDAGGDVVALVEYRDGTILDVLRKVA